LIVSLEEERECVPKIVVILAILFNC